MINQGHINISLIINISKILFYIHAYKKCALRLQKRAWYSSANTFDKSKL